MNLIKRVLITSLLILFIACNNDSSANPEPIDIEATVEARVTKELGKATKIPSTPTPIPSTPTPIPPTPIPTLTPIPSTPTPIPPTVCSTLEDTKFYGKVVNTTYNISSNITASFVQSGCQISGDIIVRSSQLSGSGPLVGYIGMNTINFTVPGSKSDAFIDILFEGYFIGKKLVGTYTTATNQRGTWELSPALPAPTPRPLPTATPTPIPTATPIPALIASKNRIEGKKQFDAKNYTEAIEYYTKAIKNAPYTYDYYWRGRAYYELKLYELALNDLNQTIKLDPHPNSYNMRGLIYRKLGFYQKAIDDYTKAIEIDEEEGKYSNIKFFNRGYAYSNIELYQKAIDDYTKAIEISPGYSIAFIERAVAYYDLGLYEQSILDAIKVIQLDTDNNKSRLASAYAYMGYSRYKLGQYQSALDSFNKVLELDPISEDHDPFFLKNWIVHTKNALNK